MRMRGGQILLCAVLLLAAAGLGFLLWRYFGKGRFPKNGRVSGVPERIERSFAEAMADGVLSDEDIAFHYAPEVDAAVNTMISCGGRGDFVAAVNYDGDWASDNNWDGVKTHPLKAVVYWTVQRTETHYLVGYYFYHPRDDAELAFDRHENDLEGIMIAAPIIENGFAAPVVMYTEGHGGVPYFFEPPLSIRPGSHHDGGLLLDGDRPVIYITPNGILRYCGHSIESAKDHTTYAYVGNSGVHYYHGGVAEEPATYKGPYQNNRCSYELRSLREVYERRNGPWGDGCTFGSYGAFRGNRFGRDRANPPWNWQNKTSPYKLRGSFLTDPAWTIARAVDGLTDFSETYTDNRWADWKLTVQSADRTDVDLVLYKDGEAVSGPDWLTVSDDGAIRLIGGRTVLWAAGPKDTVWELKAFDKAGNPAECRIDWHAEYCG